MVGSQGDEEAGLHRRLSIRAQRRHYLIGREPLIKQLPPIYPLQISVYAVGWRVWKEGGEGRKVGEVEGREGRGRGRGSNMVWPTCVGATTLPPSPFSPSPHQHHWPRDPHSLPPCTAITPQSPASPGPPSKVTENNEPSIKPNRASTRQWRTSGDLAGLRRPAQRPSIRPDPKCLPISTTRIVGGPFT